MLRIDADVEVKCRRKGTAFVRTSLETTFCHQMVIIITSGGGPGCLVMGYQAGGDGVARGNGNGPMGPLGPMGLRSTFSFFSFFIFSFLISFEFFIFSFLTSADFSLLKIYYPNYHSISKMKN